MYIRELILIITTKESLMRDNVIQRAGVRRETQYHQDTNANLDHVWWEWKLF